ncbi:MAG: hypothetical protein WBC44_10020 [Planctomycetaceae bacterium]
MKKTGFILLLAGLTYGLATIGYFQTWTNALGAAFLLIAGTIILTVGMRREGPRDEELPTADARRSR